LLSKETIFSLLLHEVIHIYSIEINVCSESFKNREYFFWCILKLENGKKTNCGHGWSKSIEDAAADAYAYYNANIYQKSTN